MNGSATAAPAVTMFSRGATAARQRLLDELEKHVPGLKFKNFLPTKPSVFILTLDGQTFQLTLGQVEVFVVGLRLGLAASSRAKLTAEELRQVLAHQF